jgi:mannose-6-phosphate isomerase-like protein (cupin superfamily)
MIIHSSLQQCKSYTTKDGSSIRELMHPAQQGNVQQSLAQAIVHPQESTQAHYHKQTEELYHITAGTGQLRLNDETMQVKPGDTICIAPGTVHSMKNTGDTDLVFLCCCAPAYSHEDTVLVD